MKRETAYKIGALSLASAGVAGALAGQMASAGTSTASGEKYERPFLNLQVDPDIGAGIPTVRIERIRRSSEQKVSGPELAVDTGMINFEILAENLSDGPVEIDRLITKFDGLNLPSGWFEGLDIADLMHNQNGSFARAGNVITDNSESSYVIARAGLGLEGNGNDYIAAGYALKDGELQFHVARHNDWKGQIMDQSFLFEGVVNDLAGLDGVTPEPVFAAGTQGFDENERIGTIAKFDTADEELELDDTFGTDGLVEIDVPSLTGEELNVIETIEWDGATWIYAAGTVIENDAYRPFVARMSSDGTLDQAFGEAGIVLFSQSPASRVPKALGFRRDAFGAPPRIYVLFGEGSTTACRIEQLGCTARLSRFRWDDGAIDAIFGNQGTATIPFPDSLSDIPFGLALLDSGKIVVGATRMQKVTKAPWIGLAGLNLNGSTDLNFGQWGYRLQSFDLESVGGRGLELGEDEILIGGLVLTPNAKQVALFRFDTLGNLLQMTGNRQDPTEDPGVGDFFVDAKNRFVAVGYEVSRSQLTRFRDDGRLDWRGVIDYNETQRIRWPDDREVDFPDKISFDLYLEEWILPYQKTLLVEEDGLEMALPLEEQGDLEWWRVNQHHRLRDKHRGALSQRYAYDLSLWRWSKKHEKWTNIRKDYDKDKDSVNSSYLAYGRKIRAGKAGIVVGCWNTAPENQDPPNKDAYVAGEMPTGGNVVDIKHNDGSIAHYSHLQPGSIPAWVCPNTCATYTSDTSDPWTPADANDDDATCNEAIQPAQNIWVQAGDVIGNLGNAGNSTGPHLHFHVIDAKRGRPVYFKWTTTERQVHVDKQNGEVSLHGVSAPGPEINDVHNLLRLE